MTNCTCTTVRLEQANGVHYPDCPSTKVEATLSDVLQKAVHIEETVEHHEEKIRRLEEMIARLEEMIARFVTGGTEIAMSNEALFDAMIVLSGDKAIVDVANERHQHIANGYDEEHDDQHTGAELAIAAAELALTGTDDLIRYRGDWNPDMWGLCAKHSADRRHQLVIAASLIIAEIGRVDRAEKKGAREAP